MEARQTKMYVYYFPLPVYCNVDCSYPKETGAHPSNIEILASHDTEEQTNVVCTVNYPFPGIISANVTEDRLQG